MKPPALDIVKQAKSVRSTRHRFRRLLAGAFAAIVATAVPRSRGQDAAPPQTTTSEPAQTAPVATPAATAPPPEVSTLKGLSIEELMDVKVTTVTRTESTVGQSPAAVFVITPEMIHRSGAAVIPELFRMVPGMEVAEVNAGEWAVGARGYSSVYGGPFENKLLVQMDGRTLYNPIFSGVYWDNVDYPLNDIERIEVIRGPGGSVWGANAVDGVINIITKPAQETQGGFVSGGGGTADRAFGEIRYGGKIDDDVYYRVYGKGIQRDDSYDAAGDPHDEWTSGHGGFRVDWQPPGADSFTLQGEYFHSDEQSFSQSATAPFRYTGTWSEVSDGENALARWTHQVDKDSSWTLQAYWDRVQRDAVSGTLNVAWSTVDVDFQHHFRIGERQEFNYGLEYRFSGAADAGDVPGSSNTTVRTDDSIYSAFLQDQIALVEDRLTLTLGSKFENNSFTGFEWEPSARLLWTPSPRQTAWAAVSRAVRTPDVLEHSGTGAVPQSATEFVQFVGNSALQSEDLVAYEAGYRAQVTSNLSLDVASYYNVIRHLGVATPGAPVAGPAPGSAELPIEFLNGMQGTAYGAEVGGDLRISEWWRLRTAYTFLKTRLNTTANLSPAFRAFYEDTAEQSPNNQVYLQSSWDLPGNIQFDLIGRYVEDLHGFSPEVPSYISLDARLAWRPRSDLELAVTGKDLLDNHHPEFGGSPSVQVRRSVFATITYTW
jgi:iron complex outermembrane receptor protein